MDANKIVHKPKFTLNNVVGVVNHIHVHVHVHTDLLESVLS